MDTSGLQRHSRKRLLSERGLRTWDKPLKIEEQLKVMQLPHDWRWWWWWRRRRRTTKFSKNTGCYQKYPTDQNFNHPNWWGILSINSSILHLPGGMQCIQSVTISHSVASQFFVALICFVCMYNTYIYICIIMYIFKFKYFQMKPIRSLQGQDWIPEQIQCKGSLLPKGARIIGQDSHVVHTRGDKCWNDLWPGSSKTLLNLYLSLFYSLYIGHSEMILCASLPVLHHSNESHPPRIFWLLVAIYKFIYQGDLLVIFHNLAYGRGRSSRSYPLPPHPQDPKAQPQWWAWPEEVTVGSNLVEVKLHPLLDLMEMTRKMDNNSESRQNFQLLGGTKNFKK